jgi:putative DNA primase/helicase
VAANDEAEPTVAVRGDRLVRMTEAGLLKEYDKRSLRDELSYVAEFGVMTQDEWSPKKVPVDIVDTLLSRDSDKYPGAPRVDRVVTSPVVTADETIITTAGCHREAGVWYRPARGFKSIRVPDRVEGLDDLAEARDFLMDELLGDFVWADEASKANAIGLLLLPFVRELIIGPTPMHAIIAPDIGTGKTLLAHVLMIPAVGVMAASPSPGASDEAEWRKHITAELIAGPAVMFFDNVGDVLGNSSLAGALTTGVWSDRVLGHSHIATVDVRNVWLATGNNMRLTRELARRTVPIFLEATDAGRPSELKKTAFRHPDLVGWAHENRAQLIESALVLVRHWLDGQAHLHPSGDFVRLAEGRYAGSRTRGSFENWSRVIGGILAAADVHGFDENSEEFEVESNFEEQELGHFLATWYELGLGWMLSEELAHMCTLLVDPSVGAEAQTLRGALPSELAGLRGEDQLLKALRMWLRSHRKARAAGFQLVDDNAPRAKRWRVRKVGEGS